MKKTLLITVLLLFCLPMLLSTAAEAVQAKEEKSIDSIAILWTSGDPEVAKKMVFPYAFNAKSREWLKNIKFIIWGPSSLLVSQDKEIQEWIKKLDKEGVELYACKWCADQYEVSGLLKELGVEVIYYGEPLTKLIKDDWKILTF